MLTRGTLLVRGALAAAAAGGAAAVGPWLAVAHAQSVSGDVDILNLALQLERLEGTLYRRAVREVPDLSRAARAAARDFGRHERVHEEAIIDLIGRLGGEPAPEPRIDDRGALQSEARFLEALQALEETGVGAYNGAGPLLRDPDVLAVAGSIVQVEGRHVAVIRDLRGVDPSPAAFDAGLDTAEVRRRAMPYLR